MIRNTDEYREYMRIKQQEYRERIAALKGRTVQHHDPNSHPSKMTPDELRDYKRECQRRYKERHRL